MILCAHVHFGEKKWIREHLYIYKTDAYAEHCQTSKMERFAKIVNDFNDQTHSSNS